MGCLAGSNADSKLEWRKCHPVLLLFECDHKEAKCSTCLMGGQTFFPCNVCGVGFHQLHKIDAREYEIRTKHDLVGCRGAGEAFDTTMKALTDDLATGAITKSTFAQLKRMARDELKFQKEMLEMMSGLDVSPAFDKASHLNANLSVGMDLLHLMDEGLVPRVFLSVAKHLNQRKGGLEEFNMRWMEQPKCDDLKRIVRAPLFKKRGNAIELAGIPKACEKHAYLQALPPLLRSEPKVYAVVVALHDWYALMHQKSFTVKQIAELKEAALRWLLNPPCRKPRRAYVRRPCRSNRMRLQVSGGIRRIATA